MSGALDALVYPGIQAYYPSLTGGDSKALLDESIYPRSQRGQGWKLGLGLGLELGFKPSAGYVQAVPFP